MRVPIGYGLPAWLDTDLYLSASEVRDLGPIVVSRLDGACCGCEQRRATDGAHIARKGMGGQQKGKDGPRVRLCRECHEAIDRHQAKRMLAVGLPTNGACLVYWLERSGARRCIGVIPAPK